jgi:hypothetical protein
MCFSAEVSFVSAALLIPAGTFTMLKAYGKDPRYLPFATLPLLFGLQQFFEGLVWSSGQGEAVWTTRYSLAYMFFSWLAWPVWVPYSAFFLEPCRRRHLYLLLAILGGMIGALQYLPYFAHDGWLTTNFLDNAISYQGTHLLDLIVRPEFTYVLYLIVIIAPLVTSSIKEVNIFGYLVTIVLIITFTFFQFAYISVFCFGGAIMSLYIIYMIAIGKTTQLSAHSIQQKNRF